MEQVRFLVYMCVYVHVRLCLMYFFLVEILALISSEVYALPLALMRGQATMLLMLFFLQEVSEKMTPRAEGPNKCNK